MNDKRLLISGILNRVSSIGSDVLNSLLLIEYTFATSDGEQYWSKEIKSNNGESLWNMIVQEASKADGHVFSAIKYALDQIKPSLPFVADLAQRLCSVAADENVLKDIVKKTNFTNFRKPRYLSTRSICGQTRAWPGEPFVRN